jgi:hypothetical protein
MLSQEKTQAPIRPSKTFDANPPRQEYRKIINLRDRLIEEIINRQLQCKLSKHEIPSQKAYLASNFDINGLRKVLEIYA